MKLILLVSIFVNIIFANELIITKTFTSSNETEVNFLFSDISIISSSKLRNIGELSSNNRDKITNTLNSIINAANKNDVCKGGSFSITPIISYDKDNRKTIGQNVNFSLNCKFIKDDIDTYNKLLLDINNHIANNDLLALPQPSINYRITDDEINNIKEELFDTFLSKISQIEDKYSKILDKKCSANNINYGENLKIQPIQRNAKAQDFVMSAATLPPIKDNTRIEIDITTQLICK